MGYVPSEVKDLISDKQPAMTFCHQNVRSLANKTDELTMLMHSFGIPITVITLTETWLTPTSQLFQLSGYQSFFCSRQDKRGGGVALLLKDNIFAEPVDEFTGITSDYEVLTVQNHTNFFSVVYRPPSGDATRFLAFV